MRKYVLNTWYPLTWSRNVGRELASYTLIEQKLVAYRKTDGSVAVLEDACPHRLLPLSAGKLKGDTVECGYHGMTFDCSGKCVRVPGQDNIPSTAVVKTFPAHENMGMLWVWMGDPELADTSKVFDLPEYHSPEWSAVEGDALLIQADYLNLADNLCDPAHVNFVHLSTLGNASGENIPVYFEEEERKVLTWRWILDAPAIPVFAKHGNFKGNVDRWHYYHYYAPSLAIIDFGSADTGTGAPEGKLDNCIRMFACHFIRPVDAHTSVDHWLHVKNFQATDAQNKELSDDFRIAFAEDKAILEAIDENEQRYPGRRPVRIAIDAAPQRMRRMVDRMIQAEAITQ